jgi:septal ring factor EnvC (AmiA/AmiB activator)
MKGIPYITRDPVLIFMDTLRRTSEDGKPVATGLRSWRMKGRLRWMLARMSPDERERALRLAANYHDELNERAADFDRSNEPVGRGEVATDSTFEAENERLADVQAKLAAAETRTAERERRISMKLTAAQRERTDAAEKLSKQEADLAERERLLEQSLADAAKSAAEATARIEAREEALAAQEAGLQQQESELADRQRPVTELELIRTEGEPSTDEERLRAAESDWWEKQLGRPLSAEE